MQQSRPHRPLAGHFPSDGRGAPRDRYCICVRVDLGLRHVPRVISITLRARLDEVFIRPRLVDVVSLHLNGLLHLDLQPRATPLVLLGLASQHLTLFASRRQAVYTMRWRRSGLGPEDNPGDKGFKGWHRSTNDGDVDFDDGPQGNGNARNCSSDERAESPTRVLGFCLHIPDCSSYGPFRFWYNARSLTMDTTVVLG